MAGPATARMITDQYDSFMDLAQWPSPKERRALQEIYGWTDCAIESKEEDAEKQA